MSRAASGPCRGAHLSSALGHGGRPQSDGGEVVFGRQNIPGASSSSPALVHRSRATPSHRLAQLAHACSLDSGLSPQEVVAAAAAVEIEVDGAVSTAISQEDLEVYLECIAEVDALGDIIEMCDDVGVVTPDGATLEQLQELLATHYQGRAAQ